MFVQAENIQKNSKIYFHSSTQRAKELYLYPLCIGCYVYMPGYCLERESYPGYTLMYIESGHCHGHCENGKFYAEEKQVIILNGYFPHGYHMDAETKIYWIHFDGQMAEKFYDVIVKENGNVISPNSAFHCAKLLREIYDTFEFERSVNEPVISKYITDILTELLEPKYVETDSARKIHESIHFMNERFGEEITVAELAGRSFLSPYHFIRVFRKVTGKTPHDYLIDLRITYAKYYLKTTEKSIKEIAFLCGFSSESSFCNTFRKRIGSSPLQYRG